MLEIIRKQRNNLTQMHSEHDCLKDRREGEKNAPGFHSSELKAAYVKALLKQEKMSSLSWKCTNTPVTVWTYAQGA